MILCRQLLAVLQQHQHLEEMRQLEVAISDLPRLWDLLETLFVDYDAAGDYAADLESSNSDPGSPSITLVGEEEIAGERFQSVADESALDASWGLLNYEETDHESKTQPEISGEEQDITTEMIKSLQNKVVEPALDLSFDTARTAKGKKSSKATNTSNSEEKKETESKQSSSGESSECENSATSGNGHIKSLQVKEMDSTLETSSRSATERTTEGKKKSSKAIRTSNSDKKKGKRSKQSSSGKSSGCDNSLASGNGESNKEMIKSIQYQAVGSALDISSSSDSGKKKSSKATNTCNSDEKKVTESKQPSGGESSGCESSAASGTRDIRAEMIKSLQDKAVESALDTSSTSETKRTTDGKKKSSKAPRTRILLKRKKKEQNEKPSLESSKENEKTVETLIEEGEESGQQGYTKELTQKYSHLEEAFTDEDKTERTNEDSGFVENGRLSEGEEERRSWRVTIICCEPHLEVEARR